MSAGRTVVLAPDSFKGTATAVEVVEALADGWRRRRPDDRIVALPLADGGEGTLDAVERAVPGSVRVPVEVAGPLGAPAAASWLLLPDGTGVVELASTCGLGLAAPDALHAHTTGFGQAVRAALDHGVDRLLLAIGGSASTDGGAGALTALGARLTRADGSPPTPGGAGLLDLAHVDLTGLPALPRDGVRVLGDVVNPLTGPAGAAAVFGPQKGASPADVALLDRALAHWATLLPGADPDQPGAGAAGGTGFALHAWGAVPGSGAEVVLELTGLAGALADASVVVTGEGAFDAQSASGKLVGHVLAAGRRAGADVLLVTGRLDAPADAFDDHVVLTDLAGSAEDAARHPAHWLTEAGAALADRSRP